jgi:glycosyltransferase involved in cell wall biosynthesis
MSEQQNYAPQVVNSQEIEPIIQNSRPKEFTDVSLVIPVYNQSEQVLQTLEHIRQIMDSTMLKYEIIVVNDGSKDNTLEILNTCGETDSRLKILSYPKNMGKGYAVRTGIMSSHANACVFIDGDLEVSTDRLIEYIKSLESDDLIIASKAHPLSKINAPISRRIQSKAFSLLVGLMLDLDTKDTQSGLKVGTGDILRTLFQSMTVNRYAFDVELLAMARAMNLKIKEMPVELNIQRRFKVKDMLAMFKDLMVIAYRYRKGDLVWKKVECKTTKILVIEKPPLSQHQRSSEIEAES